MTQTAPPAAADGDKPWDLHRPIPETDHPTDTGRTVAANPARVRRRPDMVGSIFHPQRLEQAPGTPEARVPTPVYADDDPASIRMQELADQRQHPWDAEAERAATALAREQQPLKHPTWDDTVRDHMPLMVEVPPGWAAAHASPPRPGWAQGLEDWWVNTATHDIESSLEKIVQYGGSGSAYDLIATGHDLAALNGRTVGDEEAAELAVLWYLASKVNRMMAAAIDGRRGSDDTALDISYYSFMLRRIRAVGGWPIAPAATPNTEEKTA